MSKMFFEWVIGGLPSIELHGAVEALDIVGAFLGWAVEEAGARELENVSMVIAIHCETEV